MQRSCFAICVGLLVAIIGQAGTPWTLDQAKACAASQVKIERLRKQKPADWHAISREIDITMTIVRQVDTAKGTTYAVAIPLALAQCRLGTNVAVEQQTIAKGLQHVVVLAMGMCLDEAAKANDAEAAKYIAEAAALFEGIRPTFIRRDSDFFGGEKTLEAAADKALALLTKNGKRSLFSARRSLNSIINRTYALCVYFEMKGVETLRATNRPQCARKLREGEAFYAVISDSIKRRSPSTDQAIHAMFKLSLDALSSAEFKKLLTKGLGKPFVPKKK